MPNKTTVTKSVDTCSMPFKRPLDEWANTLVTLIWDSSGQVWSDALRLLNTIYRDAYKGVQALYTDEGGLIVCYTQRDRGLVPFYIETKATLLLEVLPNNQANVIKNRNIHPAQNSRMPSPIPYDKLATA